MKSNVHYPYAMTSTKCLSQPDAKRYAETLSLIHHPIQLLRRYHHTVKGISRASILYTRNEKEAEPMEKYTTRSLA